VPDEEAGRHAEALKAHVESLLRGGVPWGKVLSGKEAKGIEIPERGDITV